MRRLPRTQGTSGQASFDALAARLASGSPEHELTETRSGLLPRRDLLEERISAFLEAPGEGHAGIPERLRQEIGEVLRVLYDGAPPPPEVNDPALEMVVVADGARPIFFFEQGMLRKGAGSGPFVDLIERNAAVLQQAARSVGRIESDIRIAPSWADKWFAGTGFLVGPGLLMTNRHVMQTLVNESASRTGPFTLNGPYWINFDAEFGAARRHRFRIAGVAYAGPAVIGNAVDLSKLDLAILRVGDAEEPGAELPATLPVATAAPVLGEPVYLTGYPGRPKAASGPQPGPDSEIEEVLIRLFDSRFGGKRCASGEIDALPGFPEDGRRWAVKHDVSTLNGNSGSPMLSLTGGSPRVAGLHFGGASRITNYGHAFDRLASDLAALGIGLA